MTGKRPQRYCFPVPIDGARDARFAGFFYAAEGERRNLLQVLVHDVSHDHRYGDVPTINGRDHSRSMVGVYAEANWQAADTLVVTGTGHDPLRPKGKLKPGKREALMSDPCALVPQELRGKLYHLPQMHADVVRYDSEVMRTRIPSQLWGDTIVLSKDPDAAGVYKVQYPVHLVLGEFDPTLSGTYGEEERSCYRSSARVTVEPIPDIGHGLKLHLNRELSWNGILNRLSE